MALIPYIDMEAISDEARQQIEHFEKEHDRPGLLRHVVGHFPAALSAVDGMYHPVMETGNLSRRLKEMLFVVSAHARECPYCTGGHSRFLVREFGFSEEEVVRLRERPEDAGRDPAEQAAASYVRKISTEPYKTTAKDVESLEGHGYSAHDVLEMTVVAAVAGFTTTFASSMHLEDDLEAFGMDGYF